MYLNIVNDININLKVEKFSKIKNNVIIIYAS